MDRTLSKAEGRNKAGRRPKPEARTSPILHEEVSCGGRTRGSLPVLLNRKAALIVGCQIRAVTFDVGGTLIECWPSVGDIYAEVASRHGLVVSASLLNRRFRAAWQALREFRHARSQWAELVDRTFSGMVQPLPSQTFFPELYDRFSEPDAWHIYEDVIPALAALKARGLKLGVVSNWDDRLRPLLRRLSLDSYFDVIVVSCEEGICKPAPELFVKACAALGSTPRNTLHIGDHPVMDLQGAQAAGLQALRLRRGAKRASAGQVGSLRELHKI